VLVFHIFGVILWIGSLLLISTLMMLVADEVGVAKERLIVGARRLFSFSGNIGAAVAQNRQLSHREPAINLYNGARDIRRRVGK